MLVILIGTRSQAYKFSEFVKEEEGAPGGPGWSKSSKFGQHLLLAVHKPAKISKQTTHKDAQNHFGQLVEKVKTARKILS
jgi:hypothetical protein